MDIGIIYLLNEGGGFFSTFFFICKAYLTSRRKRIPFYIENKSWPYTFEKGWHDYMSSLDTPPNHFKIKPLNRSLYVTHNTQSKDPEFRLLDYQVACHDIFKIRIDLRDRAHKIIQSMKGDYKAVFVRRGDKLNEEAPYISVEDILEKIPHTEETVFFVQTDDYTVIEEFKQLHPSDKIVYTVPEYKRGQYLMRQHKNMDNGRNPYIHSIIPLTEQPKHQIKEETEEMLVGLTVCYMAPECWTDCTSNVGRFLKLMSTDTVHFYPKDYAVNMDIVHCPSVNFPFE